MAKKGSQLKLARKGGVLKSLRLDAATKHSASPSSSPSDESNDSKDRFFRKDTPLPRFFQLMAQLQMGFSPRELNKEHPRRVWELLEKAERLGIIKIRPEYFAHQRTSIYFHQHQLDCGLELLQEVLNTLFPQENGCPIELVIVSSGLPHEIVGDSDFNGPYARCIAEFVKNAVNDRRVQEWLKAINKGGMAWGRHMYWLTRFVKQIRLNQKRQKKVISPLVFPVWGHALPQGVVSAIATEVPEKAKLPSRRRLRPSDIDCTKMARSLTRSLGGDPTDAPSLVRIPGVVPPGPLEYRKWFYEKCIATNADYLRIFGPNPLLALGGTATEEKVLSQKLSGVAEAFAGQSVNKGETNGESDMKRGDSPSTLIREADTLLVAIGDEDAALNYLHGLALRDVEHFAPHSAERGVRVSLPHPNPGSKPMQVIPQSERGIIYGDIGGSFIYQKSANKTVNEPANLFSSVEERWAGLTLNQIHHVAVSANKVNKHNGVMVWAIGRSRAEVVLAAVAYGAKDPFPPYTNARVSATGSSDNTTPYQLVNRIVMDGQLAAQLLEKLQRPFVNHQIELLKKGQGESLELSEQEELKRLQEQEAEKFNLRFQLAVELLRGGD